jgi:hypothetical protein
LCKGKEEKVNINEIIIEQGGEWTKNGWVVKGNLDLSYLGLTQLPEIHSVGGYFSCSDNQLTSLQYAPQSIGSSFYCDNNQLTSLQYAPQLVRGSFDCGYNHLTSLQYAPQSVGGDFWCSYNQLTSLQYAPKSVGGSFICHNNPFHCIEHPIVFPDGHQEYWLYGKQVSAQEHRQHFLINSLAVIKDGQ